MKLKVNPTRQELLKIKKRLKTAESGHDLLKEKLDGLMREFLGNIRKLKASREKLEEKIPSAFSRFFLSHNRIGEDRTAGLIKHFPLADVALSFSGIMGVKIRSVEIRNKSEIEKTDLSVLSADSQLYESREIIREAADDILNYANLTIKIRLLAEEIEKTRRRVNSLEHIYIPGLLKTKKYIFQKLEERERFDRTVILKLKEFMK